MPPKARAAADTAVRVGPAGKPPPALSPLEADVRAAMAAGLEVIDAGADHPAIVRYRKALDKITVRLPHLERAGVGSEVGRFVRGYMLTGENNVTRAAARCTARLVTLDRFQPPKKDAP